MSITTIDITAHTDLFENAKKDGLQLEESARAYQVELRRRLKEQYPKANIFLKWNPNRSGPTDVFTLPDNEKNQETILAFAATLQDEPDRWLSYETTA